MSTTRTWDETGWGTSILSTILAGLTVSKSSFFYETQPCSNQLRISWLSAASDTFIFGTAFNWGKNVLYDAWFEYILGCADRDEQS